MSEKFIEVFGKKLFKSVFDANMLKENIGKMEKVLEDPYLDPQFRKVLVRDLMMDQEILKQIEKSDK